MAIDYILTSEDDLLIVNASGFDEKFRKRFNNTEWQSSMPAWREIIHVCCAMNSTLNTVSAHWTLSSLLNFLPGRHQNLGRLRFVCNEKFMKDARFWETVAVNRGLMVCLLRISIGAQVARGIIPQSRILPAKELHKNE